MSSLGLVPRRSLPVATDSDPRGPYTAYVCSHHDLRAAGCAPQVTPSPCSLRAPRVGRQRGSTGSHCALLSKPAGASTLGLRVARNSWAGAAAAGGRGRRLLWENTVAAKPQAAGPTVFRGGGGADGGGVSAGELGAACSILWVRLRKIKWTVTYDREACLHKCVNRLHLSS